VGLAVGRRVLAVVLLLLLAAGAGMGWLWWGWNAEQPTVARLRTFHQTVHVASIGPERLRWVLGERWGYLTARVEQVIVTSLPSGETEHLDFASLAQIQKLRLMRCEWSSSNLNKLAGLRKLHILGLWDLKIEKADLSFIEKLPELSTLQLRGKWVADAGFNHLAGLKHLKVLWLWETDLNDADLQEIEGLTALEYLDLRDNPISDTGLAHLQGLKALRTLWIDHRLAGSSGVTKLKQAIPGLQVRTP